MNRCGWSTRLASSRAAHALAAAMMIAGPGACASAPPPSPPPPSAEVVVAPPPRPACGDVEVFDHATPAVPGHDVLVRESMRQQLAAMGLCARPYRMHVDATYQPAGLGRVRLKLAVVVYRKDGSLLGEFPVTLSGDRSSADDHVATDDLLRVGSTQAAKVYGKSFP